jgi:hypothetical protein
MNGLGGAGKRGTFSLAGAVHVMFLFSPLSTRGSCRASGEIPTIFLRICMVSLLRPYERHRKTAQPTGNGGLCCRGTDDQTGIPGADWHMVYRLRTEKL